MDPIIGGSLIKAGAGLLGGLLGGDAPTAGENFRSHIKAVMKMSDRFGFNPLTLLGVSPMAGSASPNYMGAAIADAGLALADGMEAKAANDSRIQELEEELKESQRKIVDLTIRPKVGGIYSGNHMVPSLRQALGVSDAQAVRPSSGAVAAVGDSALSDGSGGGSLRPLSDQLVSDPRRPVDNKDQQTHSGFITIDNPYADFPIYVPTLDGDEKMGLTDLPAAALWYGASKFYHDNKATIGPARDDTPFILRESLRGKRPKAKPRSEYWTHPQTGFSAKRRSY